MTAFPEDDYLLAIGKVAYAVSYLEWTVLGDLPHLEGLPPELSLPSLAGLPTGEIGRRLMDEGSLASIQDPSVRDWLALAGTHLTAAARVRNGVLHARPATIEGRQRLYRWDPSRRETFVVDEGRLDGALRSIDASVRELSARRVLDVDSP